MARSAEKDFLKTVGATVAEHDMFSTGCKVVAGLSGGADSVAMTHALHALRGELGIELCAAHLNHGIRGDEADGDEEFSRALAGKLGIGFYSEKIDVPAMHRPGGPSVEQICRRERQEFFKRAMAALGVRCVTLAHTADDQAETALMRVIRGTSPRGLGGMDYVNGHVARPLLDVSRADVVEYLGRIGVDFRTDSTNTQDIYIRNRVRRELLPLIERGFNPRVRGALTSLAALSRVDSDFLESLAVAAAGKAAKEAGGGVLRFLTAELCALHDAVLSRVLTNAYYDAAGEDAASVLTAGHVLEMVSAVRWGRTGMSLSLPGAVEFRKGYDDVTIRAIAGGGVPEYEYSLVVPAAGELAAVEVREAGVTITARLEPEAPDAAFSNRDEFSVYIDAGAAGLEFIVRNRRDGDWFVPLGMTGGKKLQDFFVDEKVPSERRDAIPLVLCGGEICWVAGVRIGDRFKCVRGKGPVLALRAEAAK